MPAALRSQKRRSLIKAQDRIDKAIADLEAEGGDVDALKVWIEEEILAPVSPNGSGPEAVEPPAKRSRGTAKEE